MKLKEQMDLLQMKEITTPRQKKNGTKIFKLPIKMYGKYIKVGSFKSGKKDSMGRPLYTQFTTRTCELIPNEVDRLEYLVDYCLKNYYVKQANQVEDGKFIPKWKHEYEMENMRNRYEETAMELDELHVSVNGHKYKVI